MVAKASSAKSLRAFLDASAAVAFVEVADAKGSTPREKGAWMLVSPDSIYGTIGGGQLEYMALDEARAVLHASRQPSRALARRRAGGAARPMFAAPANDGALRLHLPLSAEGTPILQGGTKVLDIPLGPEIGQCCGGRVEVAISLVDKARREALLRRQKPMTPSGRTC